MANAYHMSLKEVFGVSWRRFMVLFGGVMHWQDIDEEPKPGSGSIAQSVDWSRATQIPVSELGKQGFKINQLDVGLPSDS